MSDRSFSWKYIDMKQNMKYIHFMNRSSIDKRRIPISSRKIRKKPNIMLPLIRVALKDSKANCNIYLWI